MNPDAPLDHKIRPFKRSLAEITIHTLLLLVPIALVLFTVHISQQRTWAQFMQTLYEIGEFLHGEVGWIVSLDVAIMFALFTISVGGQVLGEAMKASKMRGDLGTIAEFVAATSIVITIMMLPYYWEEPTRFLALFGVVPAVVVLVFLAAQLGSWVFVNTEGQVRETERLQAVNQELLEELGRWSSKPWPLVILVNLAAMATGSGLAFAIRNAHDSLWLMVASDLVVVSLMFIGILLFYFLRFTFKDHIKLGFSWLFLIILSVVPLVFLFTQVVVTYQGWSPLRDLPGVLIILVGVANTGFLPATNRSKFWMDWSIQGVARQFAHRALVRQQDVVQAQWTHLKEKLHSAKHVEANE
ncbi:hypothetical protein V5R04_13560 [Jonesiaceae bacterium BS-20]|uniref:Uncharacterized protein n=1 Tax=Jonesiaceae bacterium BS-20 TaxID=3120821 RepID=A0AAU7DWZ0_9MICO